ncbi:metal ABC transporter substrate-binding protein [Streptomyces somaliensis DSM 40738]|uniref:Zinc ABC transporter substrate-binding protein n=1 Tax=Streptomyces somaliensis (strain ATCC 33201 / DSM 40738 / JCM 12659 / KCTC 9044 / NCTC 11332 / NRRL B-12077 / IP 733) TaxID=1134445 RepID=A0AA44IBI7_STRE0|nr:metal ABC transporter substrate-binding protein [Streptomyces somaliensis]MCQ0022645.1 metal ABC transporter substrate-binding protein [Streptomyces somaliensis DSM 40738]NKY12760.1 zinc ABC transporter substrate-binding protein [Streptomyces somaliensis DSM 40738]
MNARRSISTTAAGVAALGLVALSACSGPSGGAEKNKDGKLDVVASFYPMQFLAEQIGGDEVSVTTLTRPGVEPHDLELKPRQIAGLGDAGFVLYLKGLQPAVDEAIEQAGVEHTVDAATLTALEAHGTHEDHDHGGHEARTEEPRTGGHDGHDHAGEAGGDPHVWLDPVKYAEIAKGVGDRLAEADPDNAATYEKNADGLVKRLRALDTRFRDGLRNTATRTFITTHSAFGYLAERYGLDQEGVSGVDPESDPSPARVKELQGIAKKEKVTTVFFETLASDRTARTLAKDTGLRTDVLDPLEGITERSKGADYFEVMEANLAALRKALGAK